MIIQWSEAAKRDLHAIIDHILEDDPAAALSVENRIGEAVARLAEQPRRGRPGFRPGTRELIVAGLPYLVVYAIEDLRIDIVRIFHGAMDWRGKLSPKR